MSSRLIALCFCFLVTLPLQADPTLRVLNPTRAWQNYQGTIEEALVSMRPRGAYMEVGLYLTFSARSSGLPANTQLEVEYKFSLPEGSIVTDSWLWVGDDIMQALIIDQWTAASIYEGIVNRRRDPSILYKRGPDNYELRVYPLLLNDTRKVKLTYLVPIDVVDTQASVPLPLELLEDSRHPVKNLDVLAWSYDETASPGILEGAGPGFELKNDPRLGFHYRQTLNLTALPHRARLNLTVPIPFDDGLYLSSYQGKENNYYQLILQPSSVLGATTSRKVAVLIDNDAGNASIDRAQLMQQVRASLKATLSHTDFFNLFVSQLDVKQYAAGWLPADDATIDDAFDEIGVPATYSSLPALLKRGFEFIQRQGNEGTVLLISASDQFGTNQVANQLLRDLGANSFGGNVQVIDYQDRSVDQFRINGVWYRGNGYLYTNLSRATGGSYVTLSDGSSLTAVLPQAIRANGRTLTAVDLYTSLSSGFTYGRTTSLSSDGLHSASEPIVQIGKYVGAPPFSITFSGINRQDAFSVTRDVAADAVVQADSSSEKAWVGNYIRELERLPESNPLINEILNLSLEHRVLSQYSAFLALEPSDTTRACTSCVDESAATNVDDDPELPQADSLLQVYPNPFSSVTNIEVSIPASLAGDAVSLTVFDVLGRAVRQLPLRRSGGRHTLQWDGSGDDGRRLAAGVYMVVLSTPHGTRSLKAVLY
ncbi:MAG: T9SS type A sorting domain-containing protein [Rhodothermales bacterium]|nr:T9SS type A sorting domain-containing protein [Rhodothermales bacterium]MBO6779435.1 T9SS type A sorting domain-containing protein [Rhodothermales bacterium]